MEDKLNRMRSLVNQLNQASDVYYNGKGEIITDYEWDALFDQLKKLEEETGEILPDGEVGELVITTLCKEGAPLIRYRTHDLTRIIPGECPCGSKYPRIDVILGRTDDMVKVKGVNIFPSQIDEMLKDIEGASSEYQVMIDHMEGRDILTLFVEIEKDANAYEMEYVIGDAFKAKIGISANIKPVAIGELPRSEKKSTRVFDNRY